MKNVGIYYRVSTDKQDLGSQQLAVEKWMDQLGQEKAPKKSYTYIDHGISGKSNNRPGLDSILSDAHSGKIDTIIVYKLDRFSRDASSAIRMILNLDSWGVGFISVTQPVLNLGHENPFRRTMLAAFAEIAEIERETIVARVVAGLDAARKRGIKLGAPKKITEEKIQLAKGLRASGKSMRAIAKELQVSLGSICALLKVQDKK